MGGSDGEHPGGGSRESGRGKIREDDEDDDDDDDEKEWDDEVEWSSYN